MCPEPVSRTLSAEMLDGEGSVKSVGELLEGYHKRRQNPAERFDIIGGILEINLDGAREELEFFLVHVLERDEDPVIRHEAAFVLGKLKDRNTIDGNLASMALCLAASEDVSLIVRHEALEALCCFEGKVVGELLERFSDHENADIRATSAISFTTWKAQPDGVK